MRENKKKELLFIGMKEDGAKEKDFSKALAKSLKLIKRKPDEKEAIRYLKVVLLAKFDDDTVGGMRCNVAFSKGGRYCDGVTFDNVNVEKIYDTADISSAFDDEEFLGFRILARYVESN